MILTVSGEVTWISSSCELRFKIMNGQPLENHGAEGLQNLLELNIICRRQILWRFRLFDVLEVDL